MPQLLSSLLVANIFDPLSRDEENIIALYQKIAATGKYASLETRILFNQQVRQEFTALSLKENWDVTYWLTSNLNQKKFNLSHPNPPDRLAAVAYVKELIDLAHEGNASYVGFGSGKVGNSVEISYQAFYMSLQEILTYLRKYPQLKVLIEPLDMTVDKKYTLGDLVLTKRLFSEMFAEVSLNSDQLYLCLDTAHFTLNGDDFIEVLNELSQYSNRVHFANAVLDEASSLYGDQHLMFGPPGFLTNEKAKEIMRAIETTTFRETQVYVTAEVRGNQGDDLWQLEEATYDFIQNTLSKEGKS